MVKHGLNPEFHLPDNIADLKLKTPLPEGKTGIIVIDAANKSRDERDRLRQRAEEAEKNSMIDSLTDCYSRNFFEKFKKENFDPNRDNGKLGLVFVDVNNLKTINDNQGHEAGDKLIKSAANFLKSSFRKDDMVVRLGGDEFVVICRNQENDPNFRENLPRKVTERLTEKLSLREKHKNSEDLSLSMAFGTAVYDQSQDFSNLDKTKDRADTLMYQHKKASKAGR